MVCLLLSFTIFGLDEGFAKSVYKNLSFFSVDYISSFTDVNFSWCFVIFSSLSYR